MLVFLVMEGEGRAVVVLSVEVADREALPADGLPDEDK